MPSSHLLSAGLLVISVQVVLVLCWLLMKRVTKVRRNDKERLDDFLRRAADSGDEGDLSRALDLYQHAAKVDETSVDARAGIAIVLCEMGRLQESVEVYQALNPEHPDHSMVLYGLGTAYCRAGNYHMARDAYESALALRPDDVETLMALGWVYDAMKENEKAACVYGRFPPASDEYADARYYRGCALHRLAREEEALECCRSALNTNPIHKDALQVLTGNLREGGCHRESLRLCEKAKECGCEAEWLCGAIGESLAYLGRYAEALPELQRYVDKHPDDAEGRFLLAKANENLGKIVAATHAYERAESLDSELVKRLRKQWDEGGGLGAKRTSRDDPDV